MRTQFFRVAINKKKYPRYFFRRFKICELRSNDVTGAVTSPKRGKNHGDRLIKEIM